MGVKGGNLLSRIKHVPQNDAATGSVNIDRWRLNLCSWLGHFASVIAPIGRRSGLIGSGQLSHQGVPAVVIEVDASYIGVIKGAGASSTLIVIAAASPVKCAAASACLRAATACARES